MPSAALLARAARGGGSTPLEPRVRGAQRPPKATRSPATLSTACVPATRSPRSRGVTARRWNSSSPGTSSQGRALSVGARLVVSAGAAALTRSSSFSGELRGARSVRRTLPSPAASGSLRFLHLPESARPTPAPRFARKSAAPPRHRALQPAEACSRASRAPRSSASTPSRARRGRRRLRPAPLSAGGPARRQRAGEPRSRARGDPQLRLRVSLSIASRSTWRRRTSARRARPSTCRSRSACSPPAAWSHPRHPRHRPRRRALARRHDSPGARRAADCRRRPARRGATALLLPPATAAEAAVVEGLRLLPVATLAEAVAVLNLAPAAVAGLAVRRHARGRRGGPHALDLADLRGQAFARRALEVAAAGGHNLLMIGPPGAGKTMLARRLPGILPPLLVRRSAGGTAIHSVAGLIPPGAGLLVERPFRAPHHTISDAALVGGGAHPRPGEVASRITACCFSTRCPSSSGTCSTSCASRSRKAASPCRAPRARWSSRRGSCSSRR